MARIGRLPALIGVLLAWVTGWFIFKGQHTLAVASSADQTPLHISLRELRDSANAARDTNPLFVYGFTAIRQGIDAVYQVVSQVIAQPATFLGHPFPALGWLGTVALATFLAYALATWRIALLTAAGFLFFGLQGLWTESMDTLAMTLTAVFFSLLIGIPLGVWAGVSSRVNSLITPVLDFMQTMPTMVYLAPLTLFFLIGPASSVIATAIYAVPPVIRLTAHGVRGVSPATVEASVSLGASSWQRLRDVLLPMASRTIVLGINQTVMAALSMVTLAALIDAPGLGKPVLKALQSLDVGAAFNAGLAIVVMAIVLDRAATSASQRAVRERHFTPARERFQRWSVAAMGVLALVLMYLSHTYLWAAQFPAGLNGAVRAPIVDSASAASAWASDELFWLTTSVKDAVSNHVINPLESLLADSPWMLSFAALVLISAILAGLRGGVIALVSLLVIYGLGVWSNSMRTLAAVLLATVISMLLGLVFGVWMGRSAMVDRFLRPLLDAAQTLPPFVYLPPILALFMPGRFTAIVAAVIYAAPVAIKILADGIANVSPATVEAATSMGSTRWQMISKVQLPMARASLLLAANQALIFVLSMVVLGGLVGAGALGGDVIDGFVQTNYFGKGLAAGVAIVMLGIMLDRVSAAAAARADRG